MRRCRAFLLVLDSVGIGGAPDAARYGDEGADTLGHIADACFAGKADNQDRKGPLRLPHLVALGLGEACHLATGRVPPGLEGVSNIGSFGSAREFSQGKDTPSGHWEMMGVPVTFSFGYFPASVPSFPADLVDRLCAGASLPGILGNCHASGTEIIARLGAEHMRTDKPICYTSADSVFQIAAHEDSFGLERLYQVCALARRLVDPLKIGRVIARPFVGSSASGFRRTGNRRDLTVPPPAPTLLEIAERAGRAVVSVGKIGDIFAHVGTGRIVKAEGNDALVEATLRGMVDLPPGGILATNLVDFDTLFGHRRNVAGYAAALEAFDSWLPEILGRLRPDDFLILTADHGCDPTWTGTDHTREQVPVLAVGPRLSKRCLGVRESYSDIAATLAAHLDLPASLHGSSFLSH